MMETPSRDRQNKVLRYRRELEHKLVNLAIWDLEMAFMLLIRKDYAFIMKAVIKSDNGRVEINSKRSIDLV